MVFYCYLVAVITFDQLVYSAIEDDGLTLQPKLIQLQLSLSIPSSFNFTVRVNTEGFNATAEPDGGYCIYCNKTVKCI